MKKTESEFYQWTLEQSKELGITQDVFMMRWYRGQTKDYKRACGFKGCTNEIGMFEVSCASCIIKGWKKKNES